jgi:diguanylate cyclase (GGDEF)-like protein/putative nucleotidyltransferase with HDIG domain
MAKGSARARAPVQRRRRDQTWNPPSGGADVTALFVLFSAGPLLFPLIGGRLDLIAFAVALAALSFAGFRCFSASGRAPERRSGWLVLAGAIALGVVAVLVGAAGNLAGEPDTAALYTGSLGSLALLGGVCLLTRALIRDLPADRLVDGLLLSLVPLGAGMYFVALPGIAGGDAMLTAIFIADLGAVVFAAIATPACAGRRRRLAGALLAGTACIAAGDGLVAVEAAGALGAVPTSATLFLWSAGSLFIALAARLEQGDARSDPVARSNPRWVHARVMAPLGAVLAFPAIALGEWLVHGLGAWSVAYFGSLFLLLLTIAFGRQAYLLVENRRAVTRERGLRGEVMRRNEDLEALTGLATTMTQTLEEAPIVERGLAVLHLAAKATSSALHTRRDGDFDLAAAGGAWQMERGWAGTPTEVPAEPRVTARGGRGIVRLPLAAREQSIGTVTVQRPEASPYTEQELDLLRILAGQLAIAIQNARDYREKLEQAVRDPLTGIYNRRYFFEALDKEVHRAERYGSHASLVIFDIDNFKAINDELGHASGDKALQRVAEIAGGLSRDVDSFARIGGEEFALLLPETTPLDALIVAERIRTAVSRQRILPDRRVTVSGGISACPADGMTRELLERKADAALYWAKRNGKNLCALASEATSGPAEPSRDDVVSHLHPLVATIDAEHLHTRDHSENVAAYSVAIAQELGLDAERIMRIRQAAIFHDIGKLAVESTILEKPSALEDAEYERIKLHPAVGATMLLHAGLREEAGWVRAHHERLDGRGYPDGLAGDEIPLEARILFVADSFEAMTSDRPYRRGTDPAAACSELRRCAGTQFDVDVVEALVALVERDELAVLALGSPAEAEPA